MLRIFGLLICACLIFSGCSSLSKVMGKGEVEATSSLTTVEIIRNKRLNFVEVKIEGEKYLFFLDTGAPNVVSQELAKKLKLKTVTKQKTGDSQGNAQKTIYVNLPEMWVGTFRFTNTAAMIADLSGTPGIQCLGIDGIIGSNLMQKAVWQFDFVDSKVHIAKTQADLPHPITDAQVVPFSTNSFRTPKFSMIVGGIQRDFVKLDLGSGNGIDTNIKTFEKLTSNPKDIQFYKRLGSANYGIFGAQSKLYSSYHSNDFPVTIGNQVYQQQNIRFQDNKRSTKIGMKFLEHFLLTVNWFDNKLYLQEVQPPSDTLHHTFGFAPTHGQGQLRIASIDQGGPADLAGLSVGDQILTLDEQSFDQVTTEEWCGIMNNGLAVLEKDQVRMKVKKTDGAEKTVDLTRAYLLD